MVRQLHDGMVARVTDNGAVTEAFAMVNRRKQGCVLVPTLFSLIFSAMLMDAYRDELSGSASPTGRTRAAPTVGSSSTTSSPSTPSTNSDRPPEPPLPFPSSSSSSSPNASTSAAVTSATHVDTTHNPDAQQTPTPPPSTPVVRT
nr:unnamed protein product [Spirometra erinaceieuropaei]